MKKRRDVYSLGASGALMGLNVYLALKSSESESEEEEEKNTVQRVLQFVLKDAVPDVLLLYALQYMSRGAEDIYSSCFPTGHLGGALCGWVSWKNTQ